MPGRIQISQETADLLLEVGKSKWVYPREDKVTAKGMRIEYIPLMFFQM